VCSTVRNPHLAKYIKLTERVQRSATKLIRDVARLSYDDRWTYLMRLIRLDRRTTEPEVT